MASAAASAALSPLLFDDASYSGNQILEWAGLGVLVFYPIVVLVRFTAWSLRTVRGGPIFKTTGSNIPRAALYIAGALLFGVLGALASGFNIGTPEGLGAAMGGGPLLGLFIASFRAFFRPTDFPRWIFWTSLVALAINGVSR